MVEAVDCHCEGSTGKTPLGPLRKLFVTVVNVDRINMEMAHGESPSTNRFYRISDIVSGDGDDFQDFANRIIALTSIAAPA